MVKYRVLKDDNDLFLIERKRFLGWSYVKDSYSLNINEIDQKLENLKKFGTADPKPIVLRELEF